MAETPSSLAFGLRADLTHNSSRRSTATRPAHLLLACGLLVASGFAGLAYQIVWTQQSTSWLGHESAAVLAVVAAFFGGLACGALWLSSRIERSPHPARWYAACEVVIGSWSLALVFLLKPLSALLLTLIGPQPSPLWHWTVAFCGTFLALLPATMAMGATLPAMERVLRNIERRASTIAALYAANTLGAVLGVLGAAFWLVPRFGLATTAAACALLNLACAVTALQLAKSAHRATTAPDTPVADGDEDRKSPPVGTLALLAATGLLGIGFEVLVVRALSQVAENTVYTFAILLAVYLIGTTAGASVYARWLAGQFNTHVLRDRLIQILAGSCLLGTLLLAGAGRMKTGLLAQLPATMSAAIGVESLLAALAFLPPTVAMGALFSHLSTSARDAGVTLGKSVGFNTLGAALAPPLFSVLLLPTVGLKSSLLLIVAGYLALVATGSWRRKEQWALGATTVACFVWAPTLQIVEIPAGGRLVSHVEGTMASVSVVEDGHGVTTLHIDNRQQEGSSATLFSDARQALLPILLHPAPRRALFLGVGTGLTAFSATMDPSLQVDAVELVPEVIQTSAYFVESMPAAANPSRLHLMSADARRYVRTSPQSYDVIVSDNFHPARSGSGSLYTVEHFRFVRNALTDGGVFCQWLPLHQLDLATLRSIVRTFLAVYPHGTALLATNSLETPVVGLLSRRDGERFELKDVRHRMEQASADETRAFGIPDELALLGSFIAGPAALAQFSAGAPLNTDDHPVVAYRAPRITYAPDSLPRDRLIDLLHELKLDPMELLTPGDESSGHAESALRLRAYWRARARFIEAGRDVRPTPDVRAMLAQVQEPLFAVLEISADFRPAYDPLLNMAAALGTTDPSAARQILERLRAASPSRPEAAERLREMPAGLP